MYGQNACSFFLFEVKKVFPEDNYQKELSETPFQSRLYELKKLLTDIPGKRWMEPLEKLLPSYNLEDIEHTVC